jgi:hypothetical protein
MVHRQVVLALVATAAFLVATTGRALAQSSSDVPPAVRTEIAAGAISRQMDATGRSLAAPVTTFVLDATTQSRVGIARIGWQRDDLTFLVSVRAPLGEGLGARVADLDGLRDKSTAELGLQWSRWQADDPAPLLEPICREVATATGRRLEDMNCSYLGLLRDPNPIARDAAKRAFRALPVKTMTTIGVSASLGPERFSFVDAVTLDPGSERHASWSFSTNATILTSRGILIAGQYRHEVSYGGGSSQEICTPIGATGSLRCASRIVGAPSRSAGEQLGVEIRGFLTDHLAISPRLRLDLSRDVVGIEVPVYFLRAPDGGLAGGIALGWRSDDRAFTMTAFVGQVLGMLTR